MATKPQQLVFCLGGEIVKKPAQARRIYRDAILTGKDWLVPQARNVYILLKRAAGGAA